MNEVSDDIFGGIGVEVVLSDGGFLRIAETLRRMGRADGNILHQVCYIFHKQGRYVIAHENELRMFDGEDVTPSDDDLATRDHVAILLERWGLLTIIDEVEPVSAGCGVKVLPYREKHNWDLRAGYNIGTTRRRDFRREVSHV